MVSGDPRTIGSFGELPEEHDDNHFSYEINAYCDATPENVRILDALMINFSIEEDGDEEKDILCFEIEESGHIDYDNYEYTKKELSKLTGLVYNDDLYESSYEGPY